MLMVLFNADKNNFLMSRKMALNRFVNLSFHQTTKRPRPNVKKNYIRNLGIFVAWEYLTLAGLSSLV
jgi:hypothetical protein